MSIKEQDKRMPAYFGFNIEFNKDAQNNSLVQVLFDALAENKVNFNGGFRRSEGYTFEQQIKANQDYVNGSDDMHNGSFYQALFSFSDFSEVRGYWKVSDGELMFHMIIPEEDFYEYVEHKTVHLTDKMNAVKDLCVSLWRMVPSILCIQTFWECSEIPPKYCRISAKRPPQTEPFSIVQKLKYNDAWCINGRAIERAGMLLEIDENWLWI
ncbi:MAG: hypothetical protein PUD55_02265 [Firmicutes bacterium]|nr:hypothetical protein [Bacillota bacterium]